MYWLKSRQSFTLIELLVVLAIVAILSTVVIMTLNPAELLKQARDSTRLSDLSTLNTALAAYGADVTDGFMGTSSIVYVSIPDASSVCASLGLPALPSGWFYNCVTATSTRLTNGRGWIPVNLSNISFGSPLSALPIDPINTTSSRNYYTYVSGGSFELIATLEAAKNKLGGSTDKVSQDGGSMPDLYEAGNNLTLLPVDYGDSSLVGYWNFEEGPTGGVTTSTDYSGNGNNGTWYGTSTADQRYAPGRVGSYAGSVNGSSDYLNEGQTASLVSNSITMLAWVNISSAPVSHVGIVTNKNAAVYGINLGVNSTLHFESLIGSGSDFQYLYSSDVIIPGQWYQVAVTHNASDNSNIIYANGAQKGQATKALGYSTLADMTAIGRFYNSNNNLNFNGLIDDVRIYNRALSAAEVAALYNATK